MKKILILTLFTLSFSLYPFLSKAQFNVYHPFPDSNAWWSEESDDLTMCSASVYGTITNYYDFFLNGDTNLNGIKYHKLFNSGGYEIVSCGYEAWSDYSNYNGAIREDTLKHIYFNSPLTNNRDSLLYDFNLKVGDTLPFTYINNYHYNYIYAIDSILVGSTYRKQFIISLDSLSRYYVFDSIIEGVGNVQGLLTHISNQFEAYNTLLCFSQNDTTVYPHLNDGCTKFILSAPNISKPQNTITVYPNPSSGNYEFQITNYESDKLNVEVYNMLGEKVYSNNSLTANHYSIDLSNNPSGIYLYRIIASNGNLIGEGKLVIQK